MATRKNNRNVLSEDKGQMTVQKAGEMGGRATAETHDHDFYEEIGRKGGEKGGPRVRELIQEGKEAENQAQPQRHTKSDYDKAA
jgi:general stress protein YciG